MSRSNRLLLINCYWNLTNQKYSTRRVTATRDHVEALFGARVGCIWGGNLHVLLNPHIAGPALNCQDKLQGHVAENHAFDLQSFNQVRNI